MRGFPSQIANANFTRPTIKSVGTSYKATIHQDQLACGANVQCDESGGGAAATCDEGGREGGRSENRAAPLDCLSVCKKAGDGMRSLLIVGPGTGPGDFLDLAADSFTGLKSKTPRAKICRPSIPNQRLCEKVRN